VAIAEISIIPLGTAGPGVGEYIADVVRVLEKSGADFEVTAMGTIVQAEVDDILDLARRMHEVPFAKGVLRVVTNIRIDDRRDRKASARQKAESVRARLTQGRNSMQERAERRTRDEGR